jgi:hypothetical protein
MMTLNVTEGEVLEIVSALRNEAHRMRQHAAPGIVTVLAQHAGTLERLAERLLGGEKASA